MYQLIRTSCRASPTVLCVQESLAVIAVVLLVSAGLQSSTGFGFALLSAPVLSALLGPVQAVTTITIVGAVVDSLTLFGNRSRPRPALADLRVVCLSAAPGLAVGAVLLARLPTRVLQVAIAASVVLAIINRLRRRRIVVTNLWLGPAAGFAWGALTAATTAGGPPLLLYLMHRHDDARTIRDTIVAANLIRLPLSLALLGLTGAWHPPPGVPILIAAGVCGWALGKLVFRLLTPARYETALLTLLALTAAATVAAAFQ
ncbi:sulfite exporter TauE/SafE family protein [Kribbella sindirgiensis]|uniref:Probable membrane transporter protein n=1 Tax=Kribbella sindirgiensis TaxID=1124744 RepID=A0A4R0II16_9ACTN|nr:sulfite exporter TauE/SafE family protein [Kribbella sindirgiensis]